jgi:endonuclease/exonuclease/phosphatase family metal-dependent hydrolase
MNPIAPTEKAMRKFRETYIDSWQQADMDGVREGPVGSFNGFNPDVNLETQSRRGDYIFYKGDVKLDRYKCIDDKFDGQYPSDHLPVMVDVQLVERADDE